MSPAAIYKDLKMSEIVAINYNLLISILGTICINFSKCAGKMHFIIIVGFVLHKNACVEVILLLLLLC
jgi:hypothetical protein